MSFLSEILASHKELESPDEFWKWSALAAMSAVLKDNVWFSKQIYNVYPNIYVMLHADSGVKKGPPVNMAKKFVAAVNNTTIISGRSSIQGILKKLGGAQSEPGGVIVTKSKAFICSSELTSSIVEDKVATTILTDLYDRNYNEGEWASLLKLESFSLKDPCITMLTASNEAHTNEFFIGRDVQGGYFARTFIIYEGNSGKVNSLMFPLLNPPDDKKAVEYLKFVSHLRGPFEMDVGVREYFDTWYKDFRASIVGYKDLTGTLNRFDDSVLKVAMLLSLGEEPKLKISKSSIELAISYCEKLVGNIRKATIGRSKNKAAEHHTNLKLTLIQELLARPNHEITRKILLKKYWTDGNDEEWDLVARSLEAGGHVEVGRIGSEMIIRMPEIAVLHWSNHFAGKIQKE